MSPVDPERIERMTGLLRELRARLTDPEADPLMWEIDLYSYDDALVTTADLLEVEVSAAVRDEMGPEARADLEDRLAAAGVDVRVGSAGGQPEPPGSGEESSEASGS